MTSGILLLALATSLGAAQGAEPPAHEVDPAKLVLDYDQAPHVLKMTKPVYPKRAFQERVEGNFEVEFVVDVDGSVRDARVVKPENAGKRQRPAWVELQKEAVRSVREWRFQPAHKGGQPVPTVARAPVTFRISN